MLVIKGDQGCIRFVVKGSKFGYLPQKIPECQLVVAALGGEDDMLAL